MKSPWQMTQLEFSSFYEPLRLIQPNEPVKFSYALGP
jgi:hypothetical protein